MTETLHPHLTAEEYAALLGKALNAWNEVVRHTFLLAGRGDLDGAVRHLREYAQQAHILDGIPSPKEGEPSEVDRVRADERARCVTELRNYSSRRMEKAVPKYSSGKDSALSEVLHAAAVERAARILESGEETVSRSTSGEGP